MTGVSTDSVHECIYCRHRLPAGILREGYPWRKRPSSGDRLEDNVIRRMCVARILFAPPSGFALPSGVLPDAIARMLGCVDPRIQAIM